MTKPYTAWQYFYPPRTSTVAQGWGDVLCREWASYDDAVGQFKLNGNRNIIAVAPNRDVRFWTRHKDDGVPQEQKYAIPAPMREKILYVAPKGHWTLFDTELLHFKTQNVKNSLYFFDVLVWESQHLLGMNYKRRYELLFGLLGPNYVPLSQARSQEDRGAALGENNLFIAENLTPDGWSNAWQLAQGYDFIEGLMFKRTLGVSRLEPGHQVKNNSSFMCKLRKPTKNSAEGFYG